MLNTAGVAPEDKVRFATHLLKGGSAAWWENFTEMCPTNAPDVTREEFFEAFRSHHIPEGLMDMMKKKFHNMVQGNKDLLEYNIEFTNLAHYAGEEVSTDAKKQKRFRNGLKPALKYTLTHVVTKTFDALVNTAVKEETGRLAFEESRKHTRERTKAHPRAPLPRPVSLGDGQSVLDLQRLRHGPSHVCLLFLVSVGPSRSPSSSLRMVSAAPSLPRSSPPPTSLHRHGVVDVPILSMSLTFSSVSSGYRDATAAQASPAQRRVASSVEPRALSSASAARPSPSEKTLPQIRISDFASRPLHLLLF
ncbi:hypothetical protein QYE76_037056 [Lolium multiflorum]|uniref:Retrotransposon gag domain-containing protein n=1 Tax=Lolium multiflorum TaxID=4521 RepID=A0AAD8VQT8_LOLMU|nr:hypothetical protein QYE76_037056 [Lolium multiflorum]